MKIDPRAIQLFLAVYRAKSISGAARDQAISQPAVSVAIAQLERALGAKLFDRHRTGIKLTREGAALLRHAEAMANTIEAARKEVNLTHNDIAGPLVVGGTPGALATVVPRAVEAMRTATPRIQMRVLARSDLELYELLRNFTIDLAVVTVGADERPDDIKEIKLETDPFSLIVGVANAQMPDNTSLKRLKDASWVMPEAAGAFRRQIDALFISAKVPVPLNVIRSDSLLTTKAIVRRTDYVTILPRLVAEPEIGTGQLRAIKIREAKADRSVGIIHLADRDLSGPAETFVKYAKNRGKT
ncbi:MAG: LysR family transcriptional regulator, partial [Parvularculaceae bacterium]|nr:LysR family transcriptional regulator [Parvularculaceae bacterium]